MDTRIKLLSIPPTELELAKLSVVLTPAGQLILSRLIMQRDRLVATLTQINSEDHTHYCKRCKLGYTPQGEANEDCPVCGYAGSEPNIPEEHF